jgi:hypothetical protein
VGLICFGSLASSYSVKKQKSSWNPRSLVAYVIKELFQKMPCTDHFIVERLYTLCKQGVKRVGTFEQNIAPINIVCHLYKTIIIGWYCEP